jgi:Ca-activated chloride channel family protein
VSVFVVDRSGSMDGTKMVNVKAALRSAAGYINPGNYVGLVSYSDEGSITLDLPIGQFDDKQRSLFAGAVNDLNAAGGTATYSALIAGLKLMLDKQVNVADAKLRIIVMTDGARNVGLDFSNHNEGYVINADSEDVASKLKGLLRKEL